MPDWNLSACCHEEEYIFLGLFGGYIIFNFFLWNTFLLKPMKLIAVFVHEMGHATACWMTGGKVKAIEVYKNEGGVTKYRGGSRWFIIPAGYLGGAFWGGFFVSMSGNRIAATASSVGFVIALLVALRYSPNALMIWLCLGFALMTLVFVFLDWYVVDPCIQFVTLYYGVTIGTFSVYDIWDDLITRTVEGSDAKACNELFPFCLPRCVGVQFVLVALVFQVLGIYLALVWMLNDNPDNDDILANENTSDGQ